jgi:hypothetical protein
MHTKELTKMEAAKSKKGWADRLADGMEFMAPIFD